VVRGLADGVSARAQIAEHGALYAYMSLSTLLAFGGFGFILGRLTDDLVLQRQALRDVNRRLRLLSDVDGLTGVLNRRALQRRLRAELKRAQRDQTPTTLVLVDLDHFKQVNDTYGHVAGDRVLRRVGRHLRRLARASDSVGRMGGEEFMALLPATSTAEAFRFAERLRTTLAEKPEDSATPPVTASVGLYTRDGAEAVDLEDALRRVDAALYRAKSEGRNCVRSL
jgi:diguanylate cyclase (GGDEF)-like protein